MFTYIKRQLELKFMYEPEADIHIYNGLVLFNSIDDIQQYYSMYVHRTYTLCT